MKTVAIHLCDGCEAAAKYYLEWREVGDNVRRACLCSEHSEQFWKTGAFRRCAYFFQEIIGRDVMRYLEGRA